MKSGLVRHSPFAAQSLQFFSLQFRSAHALHPLNLRELDATRRRPVEHVVIERGRNELEPEVAKVRHENGPEWMTYGDGLGMR